MAVRKHIVRDGDDGGSIAAKYGYPDSSAIWALEENATLKKMRPNENQLFPGDLIYIPERAEKFVVLREKAETKFTVTVPRQSLKMVLKNPDGSAMTGKEYKVYDNDVVVAEGVSGGDGGIDCAVPASSRVLRVEIAGMGNRIMNVGGINPMRETPDGGASGVAQRLASLGYPVGSLDGRDTSVLAGAITRFKTAEGLPDPEQTALDETLFAALESKYGQ